MYKCKKCEKDVDTNDFESVIRINSRDEKKQNEGWVKMEQFQLCRKCFDEISIQVKDFFNNKE